MRHGWMWVLVGCTAGDDGPGAIEITGYLDADRVGFTTWGDRVQAAGLDGATATGAEVRLSNLTADALAETIASEAGGFSVGVAASDGDAVELQVADDVIEHDVVADLPPFPPPLHATATAHGDEIGVELLYDPPLVHGAIWAVNTSRDGVAGVLVTIDGGATHGGHLLGVAGDLLILWFVPEEGSETLPLELPVTAAR